MSTLPRLHLVTADDVLADPAFVDRALAVARVGASDVALHVRGRQVPTARTYEVAMALRPTCGRLGAWLFVNDRVDVALACDADGVQLGTRSLPVGSARLLLGPQRAIGASVHGAEEAGGAAEAGADFVVFGSVWETTTHPDATPAGVEALRAAADGAGAPVLAIGGVTPGRIADAAGAGAYGVAVLGGVWRAERVEEAVETYLDALHAAYADGRGKEQ